MEASALKAPGFLFEDPGHILPPAETPWHERFLDMDRYDWNDPSFKRRNKGKYAIVPIPLTQGYFMVVHPSKYKKMTTFPDGSPKKWYVKIDRDTETGRVIKVYGRRRGRKLYQEPSDVAASRELTGMLDSSLKIDHVNGWSVDNRYLTKRDRINLEPVSSRTNGSNAFRSRTKNFDLLRGVERKGKDKQGRQLYGGSLRVRRSPKTVDCYRSKRKWTTQEPAHRWYLNQLKRRRRRERWAFVPATVTYPLFPPLMDSEPAYKAAAKRQRDIIRDESLMATF